MGELELFLGDARAVVLTRGLWGTGNIGNLRVLESAAIPRIVILDTHQGERDEWDFSGGEATAILERLARGGAVVARDVRSAMAEIAGIVGRDPCRN